jgi:hypothetical protein
MQWEVDDEALAYYLAAARYGGKSLPDGVRLEMNRIDAAAKSDPVFAARLDALSRRIEELDEEGAWDSFRRLADEAPPDLSRPVEPSRTALKGVSARRSIGRAFAFVLPAAAAILLAVVLWPANRYGDLAAPEAMRPFEMSPVILRGADTPTESELRIRFDRARSLLDASRTGWLRVVPGHKDGLVQEAMRELNAIRSAVPAGSAADAATAYSLAKAHLALDDPAAALEMLEESAEGSGPYSAAAESLAALVEARMNRGR